MMETFWSRYFGVWNKQECKLSFYGDGDEVWECTTYGTAAEYVAAVARDPSSVGLQHCKSLTDVNHEQVFFLTMSFFEIIALGA